MRNSELSWIKKNFSLFILSTFFLILTLPFAFDRPSGGRSAERQAFTAGIIRNYCFEPKTDFFHTPMLNFGKNPFNLEMTAIEWLEGHLARIIDGGSCESVEPLAKSLSVLFSLLGIIALYFLSKKIWEMLGLKSSLSHAAGLCSAFSLASNELWLRYSAYSMIENRVLSFALLAVLFSLQQRTVFAFLFWALVFLQKPQVFLFTSALWLGVIVVFIFTRREGSASSPSWLSQVQKILSPKIISAYVCACILGFLWFFYTHETNPQSDLPWIVHTGPWQRKWYFGDFSERISVFYFKNLILNGLRNTGLNFALPIMLVFLIFRQKAKDISEHLQNLLKLVVPYFVSVLIYTFIFYPMYVSHEYYALPLNVAKTLTVGLVTVYLMGILYPRRQMLISLLVLLIFIATPELKKYTAFAKEFRDPHSKVYFPAWNHQIFPERALVVIAAPGPGHDLLHLYFTKQKGFFWCAQNEKFAPRAYWKSQGVKYVAWSDGKEDPLTHLKTWTVRSMEEELKLARDRGWSSDVNDVWSAHSMAEWSQIAGLKDKKPCNGVGEYDPRTW